MSLNDDKPCAALDIRTKQAWDYTQLERVASGSGASRCWLTKSGAVLAFGDDDTCTAEERAAMAVVLLDLGRAFAVESVDLLNHAPPSQGDVWEPEASETYGPHAYVTAAREHVHWAHQRVVMLSNWPKTVSTFIAEVAYRGLLAAHGATDSEIAAVFNPDWDWLRHEDGTWVRSETLLPEDVKLAASACSWSRGLPARVQKLLNRGPLTGYQPLRAAPFLCQPNAVPKGVVPFSKRRDINPSREDILNWDDALAHVEHTLPGINETYLRALLVACVCAESGDEFVGLQVAGPSGSGKTQTAVLVANILGAVAPTLHLDTGSEDWRRQIGQALITNCRPLLADVWTHTAPNRFKLCAQHLWHPRRDRPVKTPFRAPLVLTAIDPCRPISGHELGSQYRLVDLPSEVPKDWYGRSLTRWREATKTNALVADSLLACAMRFAERHRYLWHLCAEALGLPRANEIKEVTA